MSDSSIPVDDVKIEMEGAVRLPDDALVTVIAELTAWRNLAHRAFPYVNDFNMAVNLGSAQEWLDEYTSLTRG